MRFRVRVIANNKHDFSYAVSGDVRNNCKKRKIIIIMIIKKMKIYDNDSITRLFN